MQNDKNQDFDAADIPPPPNPVAALSEQELVLLERLDELDPEVTHRLTNTLDRLQRANPYQPLQKSRAIRSQLEKQVSGSEDFTPEQKATHDAFVAAELSSLLAIAGQLNKAYENQPQAQPDHHFKDYLKQQLLEQSRQHKTNSTENK